MQISGSAHMVPPDVGDWMKLTVKIIDIAQRGVLLNVADARMMGVLDGDRVQVLREEAGVSVAGFVSTTHTLIPQGTVGVFRPLNERLNAMEGSDIEVREADRPASLDLIKKKMNREPLSKDETYAVIRDIVNDEISPAELTAYVTSCYINPLTMDEVEHLTRAMVDTGDKLTFHTHPIVDKHSIGGVPGNKITLLVAPIIAACGLRIPKTSSRAITGAGGTADLMEVLAPVEFSAAEVQQMTLKVGGCIVWGGSTNIAPADDKIILQEYPFRIDAEGQMLASVMAKKLAVGADLVVIDIPVGRYAKAGDISQGRRLARQFIEIGDRLGIRVECALTYGDSPVGRSIGPALEVQEALRILDGSQEPNSLIQKSISIAGIALEMAGKAPRWGGADLAREALLNGKAAEKMRQFIAIQGGDPEVKAEDIPIGKYEFVVNAAGDGYVIELNNRALITLARTAGAPHDPGAGILLHAKKGAQIKQGDPIMTIYADRSWRLQKAIEEGRRLMPVVVEGMLLDRVPDGMKWM